MGMDGIGYSPFFVLAPRKALSSLRRRVALVAWWGLNVSCKIFTRGTWSITSST
jgi:hypothetical protein